MRTTRPQLDQLVRHFIRLLSSNCFEVAISIFMGYLHYCHCVRFLFFKTFALSVPLRESSWMTPVRLSDQRLTSQLGACLASGYSTPVCVGSVSVGPVCTSPVSGEPQLKAKLVRFWESIRGFHRNHTFDTLAFTLNLRH